MAQSSHRRRRSLYRVRNLQEDEGAKSSPRTPPSDMTERAQRVDLLGDIFWSLQGEPESPSVNLLPKSLVDIQPVGGSVEAQANSTHQVSGGPNLLPLPTNADITDPVAVSNGSTDLLSLLDPLSGAPGTEAPPPAPTAPALCPRPLGPLTVTRIPVPPFAQSSNHIPVGRPHGNYTPPGPPQRLFTPAAAAFAPLNHNHQPCLPSAPLKHSGLPLQSSAFPGLIRAKAPQSRAPPETRDPFGDLLDLSKLAAPPKTRQWETFD
ncbi:hypothetical protein AGOR_G00250010 [Albula goreensis]|uniref:Uncharacterized protein n=1 Tax=Albula goreensis TaxID=1534307 RepID=A0A8T3CBV1_9TELE|nr:hypothetical protein AGOR_G00250010 [Albula goreensis]